MSVTIMIGAAGILLMLILLLIGVLNKNKALGRPSNAGLGILLLQVGLLVLFFSGVLDKFNTLLFDIVWWGSILAGMVFGIREFRRNIVVSLLLLLLTVVFMMFMVLMLLIGSM